MSPQRTNQATRESAAAFADASDTMMARPLTRELLKLQTLIELGVDTNATVVLPASLISKISELNSGAAVTSLSASEFARPRSLRS